MSDQDQHKSKPETPYFDESLVINSRLSEIERQQREETVQRQQHERSQRRSNWTMALFTALLFITSTISDMILIRQTGIAGQNAESAKNAANAAIGTLEEVRKGSSDTHALAIAAGQQAANGEALARNAGAQVAELRHLSAATAKSADAAVRASENSVEQFASSQRPWISVRPEIVNYYSHRWPTPGIRQQ